MGVTFERLVTGSDPRHILACSHRLVRAMPNIRAKQFVVDQISELVALHASRRQSTIFIRAARQAGMKPPTKPIASAKVRVCTAMIGVSLN